MSVYNYGSTTYSDISGYKCPVCGSVECRILYIINSNQSVSHMIGHSFENERKQFLIDTVRELWQSEYCNFVECESCQFCFAVPNVQGTPALYEQVYSSTQSYGDWKWEFQETYIKFIEDCRIGEKTLLEIGAGNGTFVKKVSPSVISKNQILCTEFSEAGRSEIEKYGIQCIGEDVLSDSYNNSSKYDIVCMFQVLEHMSNIDRIFESINKLTKAGSHLYLGLPNDIGRKFYDKIGVIEDVPPIHISRYSIKSLQILAKNHNWIIVQHQRQKQSLREKIKKYACMNMKKNLCIRKVVLAKNPRIRKAQKIYNTLHGISIIMLISILNPSISTVQWVHMERIL